MSDRSIDRIITITVIIILSGTIILGTFNSFIRIHINKDLLNPLSTFLGALLGALITGMIANNIHRKEFRRIELIERKEKFAVRSILFFYTDNINHRLNSIISDIEMKNIMLESYKGRYVDLSDIDKKICKSVNDVLKEYFALEEVPIEKMEINHLTSVMLYKSLMKNAGIPILEELIETKRFDKEKVKIVKAYNDELLSEVLL